MFCTATCRRNAALNIAQDAPCVICQVNKSTDFTGLLRIISNCKTFLFKKTFACVEPSSVELRLVAVVVSAPAVSGGTKALSFESRISELQIHENMKTRAFLLAIQRYKLVTKECFWPPHSFCVTSINLDCMQIHTIRSRLMGKRHETHSRANRIWIAFFKGWESDVSSWSSK